MAAQPAPSTTIAAVVKETILGGGPEETAHLPALTKAHFLQHAARDPGTGELYMGPAEFLTAIAPAGKDYHKIKREQYGILFPIADRRGDGRLTLADWGAFEHLLSQSDAGYQIAFHLFDVEGAGLVKYDHVRRLYELNKGPDTIPFDWECEWAKLYTGGGGGGKKKRHAMDYGQFSQMLRGLQGERIRQAFQRFDTDGDGFISGEEFGRIILETARHKLSDHVLDNLHTLCSTTVGNWISYANVRAFHHIIKEMDLAELIIRRACAKSSDGRITRADFSTAASSITRFTPFTPMEADILFHFASLDEPSGRLGLGDFAKVLDPSWRNRGGNRYTRGDHDDDDGARAGSGHRIMQSVLESAHHFLLGSLAGAFGAFVVYPIDLVKTRMQNQRGARPGERLYKTSIDCFQKVLRNEGFRGLYSGIVPQLVGVAPEKAIKLTVNDLVRGHFTDKQTGHIWWGHEVIAGGTAGGCQVVFTNPLEIVKIRLQIQGEAAKSATSEAAVAATPKRSAMWIVKNLGLRGLYKGASACLLRDVPFSAIYFPTYSNLKSGLFGESPTKKLNVLQLLTAGAIAGMPAAYLTTPCDVIKTRLQVEARTGESSYTGVRHAAATIMKEEGFRAFFKGGPARIVRSSPQFGFTLAAYELLQGLFPMHDRGAGGHHEDGPVAGAIGSAAHRLGISAEQSPHIRSRNALKLILDVDESFGKLKMPDQQGWRRLPAVMGGGGAAANVGGK